MGVEAGLDVEALLARVPDGSKAEWVDGGVVRMSPAGGMHNYAAGEIFASLRAHAKRTRSGRAATDNAGFLVDLPNRKSFSPDAAYYHGPLTYRFITGAPVFAVEIRSENDYGPAAEAAMAEKRAEYFAAGTLVVWDVDLHSEDVIRSYKTDSDEPAVYRRGDVARAERAVAGWEMPVDDLWP